MKYIDKVLNYILKTNIREKLRKQRFKDLQQKYCYIFRLISITV